MHYTFALHNHVLEQQVRNYRPDVTLLCRWVGDDWGELSSAL